jgi:hypothetical protein
MRYVLCHGRVHRVPGKAYQLRHQVRERLGYEDISRGVLPTSVQRFRVMPTGLICLYDDEIVSERLAHMLQKQIHHSRVDSWQDQRRKQSLGRSNGGKDIH